MSLFSLINHFENLDKLTLIKLGVRDLSFHLRRQFTFPGKSSKEMEHTMLSGVYIIGNAIDDF